MPQYAVIARHPPNDCPMTNKAVREFYKKIWTAIFPTLAKQLNVKLLTVVHLDPNHEAYMQLEAPNEQAVRDLMARAGMLHFQEINYHTVTPLDELFKHID